MSERPPGTSPPDRGTRRARAVWRATAPLMFAGTVLFGIAAAIFGPIILYELIVRGVRESRPSWVVLGVICGVPWVLVVYAALKRALRPAPPPPAPPPPPSDPPPGERRANGARRRDDV